MISHPFRNNTDFGIGDFDRVWNTSNIQPFVPIVMGTWALINRLILPVVYGSGIGSPEGDSFGLGIGKLFMLEYPSMRICRITTMQYGLPVHRPGHFAYSYSFYFRDSSILRPIRVTGGLPAKATLVPFL